MLMEEKLVLVTTDPSTSGVSDPDYVYVDWGPDFAAHHGRSYPQFSNPGLSIGLGPLGLDYIIQVGGTGYFRKRVAQPYLAGGRLHLVPHAPEFTLCAYAAHSENAGNEDLETALEGLREAAHADEVPSLNQQVRAQPKAGRSGIDLGASVPAG
jgi:hypothetical protein